MHINETHFVVNKHIKMLFVIKCPGLLVFHNNSAKYGIDLLLTPRFIIRGCKAEQQVGRIANVCSSRRDATIHPL